jgi:hypothetical protein
VGCEKLRERRVAQMASTRGTDLSSAASRGRLVNLNEDLDWINQRLGLDKYPIVHRPPPEHRIWLFDR